MPFRSALSANAGRRGNCNLTQQGCKSHIPTAKLDGCFISLLLMYNSVANPTEFVPLKGGAEAAAMCGDT